MLSISVSLSRDRSNSVHGVLSFSPSCRRMWSRAERLNTKERLVVEGVKKTFKKRTVVKGGQHQPKRGEFVGLLGPNGAGKTTVFYMITGLIKPDEGSVFIDGFDVTPLSMYRRARLGIGYLPQEASIFRGLSVEDNIMAVLQVSEPDKKERKRRLDELLEEFKIGRLRKSPSIALSGGERPAVRDRPRLGHPPRLHAPRRTLRGNRSACHQRH